MKSLWITPFLALLAMGVQEAPKPAMKKPEIGKPAPAVRLNDHHGNIVELGGKRANWTVLAFFPKAATPG
jgi:hypothetical protein